MDVDLFRRVGVVYFVYLAPLCATLTYCADFTL